MYIHLTFRRLSVQHYFIFFKNIHNPLLNNSKIRIDMNVPLVKSKITNTNFTSLFFTFATQLLKFFLELLHSSRNILQQLDKCIKYNIGFVAN